MTITVRDRQTLLDIAVQYLGSAVGVMTLAERNGIQITARLRDGQQLEYELDDIVDAAVVRAYDLKGIVPATEIPSKDQIDLLYKTARAKENEDGCIIMEYIWQEDITGFMAEFDNNTVSAETVQKRAAAARRSKPIDVDGVEKVADALSRGTEVVNESGETLLRIFTDQFNDVFA